MEFKQCPPSMNYFRALSLVDHLIFNPKPGQLGQSEHWKLDQPSWRTLPVYSIQAIQEGCHAGRDRVTLLSFYQDYTGDTAFKSLKCKRPYSKTSILIGQNTVFPANQS